MYKGSRLGIVIPAYNEEKLIAETLKGMPSEADRIYVVNDGSKDRTREIAESYPDKRIRVINNPRNMGVTFTVVAGYKKALADGMDIIVKMDGDNQMRSAHLPDLLEPIISGKADYAKGNRLSLPGHTQGMSAWRLFGNWMLTFLTKVSSGYWRIGDPQNGFTAISRNTLTKMDLNVREMGSTFENAMLIRLNVIGARVVDVPHPAKYGEERSKIRYPQFIVKTSWLLLKGFIWRLWMKYIKRPKNSRSKSEA